MAKKYRRIKDTSKTYPRVDGKEVAKALNANLAPDLMYGSDSRGNYVSFMVIECGRYAGRRAYELSDTELLNYKFMSEADGQGFFQCFYLGSSREKNFFKRISGFVIKNSATKETTTRVAFYEKA